MDRIELYDIVEITADVPGTPLRAGMSGTVIDRLINDGLEVEFEELEEATGEIVTCGFQPEQLRRLWAYDTPTSAPVDEGKPVKPEVSEPSIGMATAPARKRTLVGRD